MNRAFQVDHHRPPRHHRRRNRRLPLASLPASGIRGADAIRLFAEAGTVTFRNIRVRPLTDRYEPYPGWREARENADPLALNYHLMHPGGTERPRRSECRLLPRRHLSPALHPAPPLEREAVLLLRPRHQPGHAPLDLAADQAAALLHRARDVQRHRFSHQGRQARRDLSRPGSDPRRNQIAIAKDRKLTAWEKPYPVEVKMPDGSGADMRHWDPDCFLIGDTYYAISGGQDPPVFKSKDLKNWTYVGPFLSEEPPNVAKGEDISCANFFPIGSRGDGRQVDAALHQPPARLPLLPRRLGCRGGTVRPGNHAAHDLAVGGRRPGQPFLARPLRPGKRAHPGRPARHVGLDAGDQRRLCARKPCSACPAS